MLSVITLKEWGLLIPLYIHLSLSMFAIAGVVMAYLGLLSGRSIRKQSIASPAGASVVDEVNRLTQIDFTALSALPQWQSTMNTLIVSTAEN